MDVIDYNGEDIGFAFGRVLKSNTARALRRAALTEEEKERVRRRVVGMLVRAVLPHEFGEYAKPLKRIGVGSLWTELEEGIDRENEWVVRHYEYLREAR